MRSDFLGNGAVSRMQLGVQVRMVISPRLVNATQKLSVSAQAVSS